jgi:8-oxo-dGTP diphosphatase
VYEHATVDLHFFRVTVFRGEPHGRENQRLAWQRLDRIDVEPILPANGPILSALRLPNVYALTDAGERGTEAALRALDAALGAGLRLVQVREPSLAGDALLQFASEVTRRAHAAGAQVLVNADVDLAQACGADGVHLKSAQLGASGRPPFELVGASCHDAAELAQACALGVDFVALGSVAPTRSHPDAQPLGWPRFAELVRSYALPVYALGGMQPTDLETAWHAGAHGIAMQRAVWEASRG